MRTDLTEQEQWLLDHISRRARGEVAIPFETAIKILHAVSIDHDVVMSLLDQGMVEARPDVDNPKIKRLYPTEGGLMLLRFYGKI